MRAIVKAMLPLCLVLMLHTVAAAQTFTAVLTDPSAKGQQGQQVWGTATFTLNEAADEMAFAIFFRSDLFINQEISIRLGTPTKPGPILFQLASGQAFSPILGNLVRGNERPQPEYGILDWDDAISAMFQNKTFLKMEAPAFPVAGLGGKIKRY